MIKVLKLLDWCYGMLLVAAGFALMIILVLILVVFAGKKKLPEQEH